MKVLFLFDFDGVMATPFFTEKDGLVHVSDSSFSKEFATFLQEETCYDKQKPNSAMQKIVNQINEEVTGSPRDQVEFGILSYCMYGSQEVFAKLKFLKKYYSGINWQQRFYGVSQSSQKADVLWSIFYNDDFDRIVYVDDDLCKLTGIEDDLQIRWALGEGTYHKGVLTDFSSFFKFYHVITFMEKENKQALFD